MMITENFLSVYLIITKQDNRNSDGDSKKVQFDLHNFKSPNHF